MTTPATLRLLVDSFTPLARDQRWDTFEHSSGRCWDIANELALHALELGIRVEIRRVTNPRARRTADAQVNFVALDGWAIDYASRGGLDGEAAPWPDVRPLAEYVAGYGPEVEMCTECGVTRSLLAPDHQPCGGPYPREHHVANAQRRMLALLSGEVPGGY